MSRFYTRLHRVASENGIPSHRAASWFRQQMLERTGAQPARPTIYTWLDGTHPTSESALTVLRELELEAAANLELRAKVLRS